MTIYGKGCISNYRNCSLSYVWYSVLYRMLTYCAEHKVSHRKRLEELNIPFWHFYKAKKKYVYFDYNE